MYLEAIENPVESRNYFELSEKQDQKTEGIQFVYGPIRASIPKSSWLLCCVKARKVKKKRFVIKLNTKRVGLNEVTQHKKKY